MELMQRPVGGAAPSCAPSRGSTSHPPTPPPVSLRHRLHSWRGARWEATSAWCALGSLRDFGGGLAAPDVARACLELPARRQLPRRASGLCGVARRPGMPTTATQQWSARRLSEKIPLVMAGPHPPSHPEGRLGGAWVFALIKGFFRGEMYGFLSF